MRTITIEFQLVAQGQTYDVEAELIAIAAAPNPESDWDAKDHFEVVDAKAFLEGKEHHGIYISDEVVYHEFLRHIRDAEIAVAFAEEEGGF